MSKVNCAFVRCSSNNCGINKWKKVPSFEQGDKNLVKGQCPNCERPYSLYCFPAELTKGKEKWMDSDSQTRKSKQNFLDGIPNEANSFPTIDMDYDTKRQRNLYSKIF